jgi:hypothetical protein
MNTHTRTSDHSRSNLVIDKALEIAAQKAENAQMEPLPALAHQLYLKKQGSGRALHPSQETAP